MQPLLFEGIFLRRLQRQGPLLAICHSQGQFCCTRACNTPRFSADENPSVVLVIAHDLLEQLMRLASGFGNSCNSRVTLFESQQFANKESKAMSSCSSLLVTHGMIGGRGRWIERDQTPHKEPDGGIWYILLLNVCIKSEKAKLSQPFSSSKI